MNLFERVKQRIRQHEIQKLLDSGVPIGDLEFYGPGDAPYSAHELFTGKIENKSDNNFLLDDLKEEKS